MGERVLIPFASGHDSDHGIMWVYRRDWVLIPFASGHDSDAISVRHSACWWLS